MSPLQSIFILMLSEASSTFMVFSKLAFSFFKLLLISGV